MRAQFDCDKAVFSTARVTTAALRYLVLGLIIGLVLPSWTYGQNQVQLNQNCIVSVLNHNMRVAADGSWVLPNVPANFGPVRARATCVQNGATVTGQSDYFTLPANGVIDLPHVQLGNSTPIPTNLTLPRPRLRYPPPGKPCNSPSPQPTPTEPRRMSPPPVPAPCIKAATPPRGSAMMKHARDKRGTLALPVPTEVPPVRQPDRPPAASVREHFVDMCRKLRIGHFVGIIHADDALAVDEH
jgi:hypothetical protein